LKGIQIVARYYGAFSRQLMKQLRVAVIDDMEQIKLIPQPPHISRIILEAIKQPIGIKTPSTLSLALCS
jgi:hypothetical protein